MILNWRIQVWTSLGFAVYASGLISFFDAFHFLEPNMKNWFRLIILVISVGLIEYAILRLFIRSGRGKGINKILYCTSFLLSGIIPGIALWAFSAGNNSHFFPFISSFVLIALLPTIFSLLYFIYLETAEKFEQLNSVSLRHDLDGEHQNEKVFHLENSNGKLLLEVPINRIICFEANDNYVVIYFMKNETDIGKNMERVSLRKIEDMLKKESVEFKRVHKSYLINPSYVEEVKGRAQAYKIKMKNYDSLVPVSRSYNIQELNKY